MKCLHLVLLRTGMHIYCRDSLKMSETNNDTHKTSTAFTVTHYYQILSGDKGCTKDWACKRARQNKNIYKVQNNNMYKIQHRQVQNIKLSNTS